MNHMVKRILILMMSFVVFTGCLTGCGNNGNDSKNENSGQNNTEVQNSDSAKRDNTEEHEPLTIVNFNYTLSEEFLQSFYEVYPEVKIEIISYGGANASGYVQNSLERGDIADIYFSTQNFSKDAQEKYLLDLSGYDLINRYSNNVLNEQDINGGIYLLPLCYQLVGIYYNKTILEENGWKVPESFNELEALSKEIEAAGYRTMGNRMNLEGFPFNYFFNIGNTAYFSTPDGTEWKEEFPKGEAKAEGNSGLKDAMEYYNRWIENGFITEENVSSNQFYSGECVFYLCLGMNQYEYTTEDGKTYEIGTMPWLSEDGSNNMLTRNTLRYAGINRSLADVGNEQKLEDALKFIDYISTIEGQQKLMESDSIYVSSLSGSTISKESPYYEISDLFYEGRSVHLVYVGWEDLIIPVAQELKKLIVGEIDVDDLSQKFDSINEGLLNGSSDSVFGVCDERLTLEQTAKLISIAEGKAVDADCAMVSLNQYHGNDLYNKGGMGWYLYEGEINSEMINIIRPTASTISILEMTGSEIKAMRDAGFDIDQNGNPYEYCLFTKGDMELEDDTTYKLAVSTGELTEDMLSRAVEMEISPASAIEEYVKELGTVNVDSILWN